MHAELTLDRSLGIDTARGLRAFDDDSSSYRAALNRFAAAYRHGLPGTANDGARRRTAEQTARMLRSTSDDCAAIGATALAIEANRIARSLDQFDPAGRVVEAERYGHWVARVAARLEPT